MIVEYIRYRIAADRSPEFEDAYTRASASLKASRQCVDYELTRCVDEPDHYILRIRWTSGEDHLEGFRGGPHFRAFFEAVKPFFHDIEEMRHYEATPVKGDGGSLPTLYQWLGGAEALERLTEVFYAHVADDDLIGPLFAHMDERHPQFVAMWLGEVFGGPHRYSEERGGYDHMVGQHVGKAVTEPQRRRWISLLMDSADEVGLPSDPEFRAVFAGYVEWGTRLALANSQPDAKPFLHAPMPHWGWGITPPYTPASAPPTLPRPDGGDAPRPPDGHL